MAEAQLKGGKVSIVEEKAGQDVMVVDFGDDAGKGMENVSQDEFRIPFIRILDPKSPQCAPPPHGLGAKPGSLLNTATNQIIDGEKGITFIPCKREHQFIEWLKRDANGSGGGFVAALLPDDPMVLKLRSEQGKFKKLQTVGTDNKAHEIAESFSLYGIMLDADGNESRVIISFSGMQLKKYQAFINRYDSIKYQTANGTVKPPLWAHKWHFKTVYEKRGEQSWYGWVITLSAKKDDGTEDIAQKSLMGTKDPLYIAAKEFFGLIESGAVKAAEPPSQDSEPSPADTGPLVDGNGEEVPF